MLHNRQARIANLPNRGAAFAAHQGLPVVGSYGCALKEPRTNFYRSSACIAEVGGSGFRAARNHKREDLVQSPQLPTRWEPAMPVQFLPPLGKIQILAL